MSYIDRETAEIAIRQRTQKRCRDCRQIKPLTEFHADRSRADGHMYRCMACMQIAHQVKRPRGRPEGTTLPPEEKRSVRLQTTARPDLAAFVQQQAEQRGVTASEYIHDLIEEQFNIEEKHSGLA